MSLKVKCFATIVDSEPPPLTTTNNEIGTQSDGHLEIHSTLYELSQKDFVKVIYNIEKDIGVYTISMQIGEDENTREVKVFLSPIFTKYAFKELNKKPIPIINQPITSSKNEKPQFESSRFWIFKKYVFVTNRHYSSSELRELKMKIHYIVKKYDDETKIIEDELRGIVINYE